MSLLFLGSKIGCAYPLSAGSEEITALGFQPMTLSADKMTASWTTTNAGELTALAAPSGFSTGASAKLPFTTGTRVIEFQSILMPAGAGGGTTAIAYQLDLNLTASATAGGVIVRLYVRKDGTRYIGVLTDSDGNGSYTAQYENTAASSFPSRVAIVADCTGGTVSVLLDGVAVTLTSATFTAGQYIAWEKAYQNSSLAAGDVGKVVGATLVTSAASITDIYYRAGATDPCGNLPVAYTPLSLFANSEVGVWYDPSDFSTMFQDAAGTTPVTAVGQSVGLRLDKSRGLALGSEARASGAPALSGSATAATYNTSTGVGSCAWVDAANQSYVTFTGLGAGTKLITIINTGAVDVYVRPGTGIGGVAYTVFAGATTTARLYATGGAFSVTSSVGTASFTVSSVREIAGNHATQSTNSSRATLQLVSGCYGLLYDGTDDFYVTPSIDFTGTDKVTVFAGVRKLSDAALGVVVELSAISTTNNGAFLLSAPVSAAANFGFLSRGTSNASAGSTASYPAPMSAVLTGVGDISGDISRLKCNGAQISLSAADQGTGNYGNYPLYIGRRSGTLLPFNGYDFGIIVRGAQTSDTDIAATERWLAQKTGVTL